MKPGDKVNISAYYANAYPMWNVAGKVGTILSVKESFVHADHLGKDDLPRYVAMYGRQEKYPVLGMMIELENEQYLVSQFGVDLISAAKTKTKKPGKVK